MSDDENTIATHWKSRVALALFMLAITFVGVVLLWVEPITAAASWYYWIATAIIFAITNILYGIYLRQKDLSNEGTNIWQDIFIWVGLLLAFYVLHLVIHEGIIGRIEGGIVILNTLGLGVFCSGVLMDLIFVLVGITIFIFAICMALLTKYMAIVIIVIGLIAAISAVYIARHR